MKLFGKKKKDAPAEGAQPIKTKKKRKVKKIFIILPIVLILAAAAFFLFGGKGAAPKNLPDTTYLYATAETRDISSVLAGSGTLQPADSYTMTSIVAGEILSANFEEGDIVAADTVLYEIDSSDTSTGIERAELTLSQAQKTYDKKVASRKDLTVTAPISGTVSGISARVGDSMMSGAAAATIEDISTMTLTEYYSTEYAGKITAGMAATVSVPSKMLTLYGTVKEVTSLTRTSATGVSCFGVTVQVKNPGALTIGDNATCWLAGSIYPSITDEDGLDEAARATVYLEISGKLSELPVRNGDTVSAGKTLMVLTSDTLDDEIESAADQLKDANLSLQNQKDTLDNFTLKAPIEGTIVDKLIKAGESVSQGGTLCTIFDLSYLSLTMNVDELDISQVAVGQTATITADAVEGKTYTGTITKVGINGTTTNGVTTYPVTIRIDETDGLLPGMNVDVSVTVSENAGVVAIPADAVQTGSRVLVKTKNGTTGDGAPAGYEYVKVTTGVSDDAYVQITDGISAGDEIAYPPVAADTTDMYAAMFGMEGGDQQGGGNRGPQGGGDRGPQDGGGF